MVTVNELARIYRHQALIYGKIRKEKRFCNGMNAEDAEDSSSKGGFCLSMLFNEHAAAAISSFRAVQYIDTASLRSASLAGPKSVQLGSV